MQSVVINVLFALYFTSLCHGDSVFSTTPLKCFTHFPVSSLYSRHDTHATHQPVPIYFYKTPVLLLSCLGLYCLVHIVSRLFSSSFPSLPLPVLPLPPSIPRFQPGLIQFNFKSTWVPHAAAHHGFGRHGRQVTRPHVRAIEPYQVHAAHRQHHHRNGKRDGKRDGNSKPS